MAEDDRRWDHAFVQESLRPVDVGEQRFEEAGSLEQRSLEHRPFASVDEHRYRVEAPRPARVVGVVGGDVVRPFGDDEAVGSQAQSIEVVTATVAEQIGERLPAGAQSARLVDEVVVAAVLDVVRGGGGSHDQSASAVAARKYVSAICS